MDLPLQFLYKRFHAPFPIQSISATSVVRPLVLAYERFARPPRLGNTDSFRKCEKILSTPARWHIVEIRGDQHPSGVLYPSFPIGQFVSRLQLSLNAEQYCTPLGCGCRNTHFYKYATPAGVERIFSHLLQLWVLQNLERGSLKLTEIPARFVIT